MINKTLRFFLQNIITSVRTIFPFFQLKTFVVSLPTVLHQILSELLLAAEKKLFLNCPEKLNKQ